MISLPGIFLLPDEIADLTDIRQGRNGKSREELQIVALKRMKLPYYISAIGRPKVARAIINGQPIAPQPAASSWEPRPA